jgi:hypothetical protein
MKPDALFVNVARRPGRRERPAGALDSRHLGAPGWTVDVVRRSAMLFADNGRRWANGEPLRWAVSFPWAPRQAPSRPA